MATMVVRKSTMTTSNNRSYSYKNPFKKKTVRSYTTANGSLVMNGSYAISNRATRPFNMFRR